MAFEERGKRRLRLWSIDAVDRRRIVATDDQQPLDAGEPRLLVVVFAGLGQIGDEIAVIGLGRRDLREGGLRLPGAALARRSDDEIALRDAKGVVAILRDRGSPIDRQRAR